MSPVTRHRAQASVARHLLTWLEASPGEPGLLAAYAAAGSELALDALYGGAEQAGWALAWPRVADARAGRLGFHRASREALEAGHRGLMEPSVKAPSVPLAELDVVLVPGVAFSPTGRRLGQGGGFYDRALAQLRPSTRVVGVAFEAQLVTDAELPVEAHDVPVAWLATEFGVRATRQGAL